MLTFALGRGVESSDRAAVRKITAGVIASQYKFSSVVLGIVNSVPFQMRKIDRSASPTVAQAK
jgi:hypothetical protein